MENGSGNLQTRNIQGNGIDQILARVDNSSHGASDATGLYFDLTDRLGSVRDVLNSTADASPAAVVSFDAWGNLISTPSSYEGMYGFDGYDFDAATSLYYDHARFYDPQSQRWMSQDPIGFDAGDSNLYRYCNNNPTDATDPSGWADTKTPQPDPSGLKPIEGEFTLNANTTSSAEKGKYTMKNGKVLESTDDNVEYRKWYAKQYDGPTDFDVKYKIVLKADKSVDPDKSSVTFNTLFFTRRHYVARNGQAYTKEDEEKLIKAGKSVHRVGEGIGQTIYIYEVPEILRTPFKTSPISITEVKLKKDGSVESFKFKSKAWYNPRRSDIIDKGIYGEINLQTGKADFTSKYQFLDDAVIVTWVTVSINKGLFRQNRSGAAPPD